MTCCTYLSGNDCLQPTSDDELNSLLAEVRAKTGDDWRIRETIFTVRRCLRPAVVVKRYTLFHHVASIEFQVINFYRPEREGEAMSSINTSNSAGHVAAYLYGVLAGRNT